MQHLGIDPGLTGAFAVYDLASNSILRCDNIPTLTITRNHKVKNTVDLHRLVTEMRDIAATYPGISSTLELVGAMPGQGVSSMFSFGRTDGSIETAVVAAGIPYSKSTPGVWKKTLSCPADKDGALLRASQLMPASLAEWTPKRGFRTKEQCKGVAEAALIAFYGATRTVDMSLLAA